MAISTDSTFSNNGTPPINSALALSSTLTCHFECKKSRIMQNFPRHDTIKLHENNFVRWKQLLKLIIDGYDLIGYVNNTLPIPPQFMPDQEGRLILNFEFIIFYQQDKLLASWLLSSISSPLLTCFTGVNIAHDVWSIACWWFVTAFGAKISRLKHDLHFLKKGNLTIKEYIAKMQNTYALLDASRHSISKIEKDEIVLMELSLKFGSVITLALFLNHCLWIGW